MRRIVWSAWVAVLAAVSPAAAEEARTLDPLVVTATKTETRASELGASVTVVTGEDFQTYQYPTVDEALRAVPGVEIRRSGSLGKTSSITIRGANSKQVQVLVDGVRVKSPTLGEVDLSDISPDLIDRIEVIRGPQSTLYGADAIGGVINIITRKGKGPFAGYASQEAGSRDTYASRAGVSGAWEILDYALGASHRESNGQFTNDDSHQDAVSLRLGATLPARSAVGFTLRYNRNETGLPVKFLSTQVGALPEDPLIDSNNRNVSETTVMTLTGRSRPVSWWETELRLGRYTNANTFVDRPDAAEQCPFPPCEFPSRIKVERREAEWLNHFHVGTWSTSTFGVELRGEEGQLRPNTPASTVQPFDASSHTTSGFFQEQLRFFERLFMSAGVRVEDSSLFGRSTTERGSLAYEVKGWGTRIRGGAGSGFRAPTFNEQFFPGFSDPTLQPETSFSWDAGVDQRLWRDRIRLGLTYFQNEFENLISFVFIPTFPFVKGVNSGKARAAGMEFTGEVDLLDTLTASVAYTYTDSVVLATRHPIPREPAHRWTIGLTWEPVRRLSLFTQVHVATQQWEPTGSVYNSGHTRVDVGGAWRLLERRGRLQSLDLTARVENLLDEAYAEVRGFPALGVGAFVGLRAAF